MGMRTSFGWLRPMQVVAMVAGLLASSCGGRQEELGRIQITLEGQLPDGSIYWLPEGTRIEISGGKYLDQVSLTAATPVIDITVPVGSFTWTLQLGGGPPPSVWPLGRQDPMGNVETVPAYLLNAQPEPLVVLPGATTDVALQFEAFRGGSITFAKGTVAVSLDVTETPVLTGFLDWHTYLTATSVYLGQNPPLLQFPVVGDGPFEVTVQGDVSGDWQLTSPESACSSIVAQVSANGVPNSTQGFVAVVDESTAAGANMEVCVGTDGTISIHMIRVGRPTTYDSASDSTIFVTALVGQLPTSAFDGDTVDLSVLSGTHEVEATATQRITDGLTVFNAQYAGVVTLAFTPFGPPIPM